jgi:hypothetical protein
MRSVATFAHSIRHSREGGNDEHETIPGSRLPIPGGPA